jgi:hypothetical protein
VTASHHYLAGLGTVAAAVFALGWLLPPPVRTGTWLALGLGLAVQGPVGWWLLRSVGTDRFLLAWMVGMGSRLALFGVFAFVLIPRLALPPGATLFAAVAVLLSLLVVEVVVVNRRHRHAGMP